MTPAPRFIVQTDSQNFTRRREPHRVVDTVTNATIDEYRSKRAATMHARELNRAAPPEAATCVHCHEPETGGAFGWYDHPIDGLLCNRCGRHPKA
jgi:nitrate/TMAO reductase-like tetraheme cytochrome c subunit